MWDEERKVGILNDFDLAKLSEQAGASGQDNTGTLPFMALDLLSESGLRGEIPRRYRHEAESFAWSLICLCLSTVEDADGRNRTREPHPLLEWFQDWKISRYFKFGLQWREHDDPKVHLVHHNTKALALALHKFWLDRYSAQFPQGAEPAETTENSRKRLQVLRREERITVKPPPYQEPEDEDLFLDLLATHILALGPSLETTEEVLDRMNKVYMDLDWSD